MESLDDIIDKRFSQSLVHLMKVIDPKRQYVIDQTLGSAWDKLPLVEQRKLYLYLLYRKWRGEGFYGTPYEIITNCHPFPTNWNGRKMLDDLIKSTTPMVRAYFNGSFGIYTYDEAKVWEMTEIRPLNYKSRHGMPG